VALASAALVAACAGATLETPPASLDGTWVLQTIDGAALPKVMTTQITIVADTLVIAPNGAFAQWSVPKENFLPLGVSGSAYVHGDSLFLVENVLGSIAAKGPFSHDTAFLNSRASHQFPNHDWVYVKS
jgi:hypothetical protein